MPDTQTNRSISPSRSNIRISKSTVDALSPRSKPYVVFDNCLTGFGCRVMPSGVKTFVCEYKPYGGGRGISTKRLKIGRFGAMTADQARKIATEKLASVRLGKDPAADRAASRKAATIADLIDDFDTKHVRGKLKPRSAEMYQPALRLLRNSYGSTKAEMLSRAQLTSLHVGMKNKPIAANRALAIWSKLYTWAASQGYIPEGYNPARGIRHYKEHARERFLTLDELIRLGSTLIEAETTGLPWMTTKPYLKHLAPEDQRRTIIEPYAIAAIRLLVLTGARLREILHARWEQVDFQRGILYLPDSKTGAKPIYLSSAAIVILQNIPRLEGNGFIIAGYEDGKPRADLKKPWKSICHAANLDGLRIHDLRHSFASFGASASLGLPVLGKLLGHKQPATTARYAHLDADPLHRAVNNIGRTIAAALELHVEN